MLDHEKDVLGPAGCTALLLDELTDNLDLESAEALQEVLGTYEGTTLTVTPRSMVRAVLRQLRDLRHRRRGA